MYTKSYYKKRNMRKIKKKPKNLGQYRSQLEVKVANYLEIKSTPFKYEAEKLTYVIPETKHVYTPDFIIEYKGYKLYIESKGYWRAEDRKKTMLILESNQDIYFLMLFQDENKKISKGSKTSYAKFCSKNDIEYCSLSGLEHKIEKFKKTIDTKIKEETNEEQE